MMRSYGPGETRRRSSSAAAAVKRTKGICLEKNEYNRSENDKNRGIFPSFLLHEELNRRPGARALRRARTALEHRFVGMSADHLTKIPTAANQFMRSHKNRER